MNGDKSPADIVMLIAAGFTVLVMGFFLFPGINTEVTGVSTTGWLSLVRGIKTLFPYIFLGAVLFGIFWMWKGHGSSNG